MAEGKHIAGLTPEMPVAEAARVVLTARLEVVRNYLPLAAEKPYEDAEYVHQLRVGTRRVGAALRVFTECFPRKHLKAVKQSLRTIRRAAGDARDWDVFLEALPASKPLTAAPGKPALDFLIGYAMGERSVAQARLETVAGDAGPRFTDQSLALPGVAHDPKGDSPPTNFGHLASGQFGELLRAFDEAVAANPTEPAALHQLRILGKRTRYALELFGDCFPAEIAASITPAVEEVQEILGDVQDATVGRDRLSALRDRVKLVVPKEWPRLRKGIEGLITSLRAKIPAGRKAFQAWRKQWAKVVPGLKLETVAAIIT